MTSLEISNLTFSYDRNSSESFLVFNNSNLSVSKSRLLGLVGVNGCGKSTLLKLIKGDLPMQEGTISIDGKSTKEMNNVSFITQQSIDNIFPKLTLFENYIIFHEKSKNLLRCYDTKEYRRTCLELMQTAGMDLEDRLDEQVQFLSGGQQQALGILLACDMASPVLLMDEPTASLDVFASEKVLNIAISEINKKNGLLILTSHNLYDIIQYTNRIIVIKKGGKMYDLSNEDKKISLVELRNKMI